MSHEDPRPDRDSRPAFTPSHSLHPASQPFLPVVTTSSDYGGTNTGLPPSYVLALLMTE